jgi:hypothetical protein
MTASIMHLTKLLRFERAAPDGAPRSGRCAVGVALCAVALLVAAPDNAQTQGKSASAATPVHQVSGGGVFFLETGAAQGGNLNEQISISAQLNADGSAHGSISSTIVWFSVPPEGGHPDPYGTGTPIHYEVTELVVDGNYAVIVAVVVFAPDFPEYVGYVSYFEVADNGGPPDSGDTVFIDGFELPPLAAGNYLVR